MQHLTVNNTQIPALGFGTFELEPEDARRMVAHALNVGYRHIDTAQIYNNEQAVGNGINDAGVARDDIFLTTKVWTDSFTKDKLPQSVEQSLNKLQTDHVDLLLLHWPNPDVELKQTMDALNQVQQRGLARNIGISNFPTEWVERAVALSDAPLFTNQVEYHPFLDQSAVIAKLKQKNLALTAYCPLAQGQVFKDKTLTEIAEAHGKDAAQITLRWLIEQGAIAIPRSSNEAHAESNLEIFDFELSEEENNQIKRLAKADGRIISPSFAPEWD